MYGLTILDADVVLAVDEDDDDDDDDDDDVKDEDEDLALIGIRTCCCLFEDWCMSVLQPLHSDSPWQSTHCR